MQTPKMSAAETTVRLFVMTVAWAPLLNLTWLPWILTKLETTTYGGAFLVGLPYIALAWAWGFWVRRTFDHITVMGLDRLWLSWARRWRSRFS